MRLSNNVKFFLFYILKVNIIVLCYMDFYINVIDIQIINKKITLCHKCNIIVIRFFEWSCNKVCIFALNFIAYENSCCRR